MGPLNIFQWYNIIFIGPAFLATFWIAYGVFTGVGHDMDGGHDHSFDADHGVGHENGFDQGASGAGVLDFLHLKNRCPKTLGFSILFLTWGVLGYVINMKIAYLPGILFLPAFIANVIGVGVVAIMVVRTAAPLIAKSFPSEDYNYPTKIDLIGKHGKVSTLMSVKDGGNIVIDIGIGAPLIKKAIFAEGYEGGTLKRNEEVLIIGEDGDVLIGTPVAK